MLLQANVNNKVVIINNVIIIIIIIWVIISGDKRENEETFSWNGTTLVDLYIRFPLLKQIARAVCLVSGPAARELKHLRCIPCRWF